MNNFDDLDLLLKPDAALELLRYADSDVAYEASELTEVVRHGIIRIAVTNRKLANSAEVLGYRGGLAYTISKTCPTAYISTKKGCTPKIAIGQNIFDNTKGAFTLQQWVDYASLYVWHEQGHACESRLPREVVFRKFPELSGFVENLGEDCGMEQQRARKTGLTPNWFFYEGSFLATNATSMLFSYISHAGAYPLNFDFPRHGSDKNEPLTENRIEEITQLHARVAQYYVRFGKAVDQEERACISLEFQREFPQKENKNILDNNELMAFLADLAGILQEAFSQMSEGELEQLASGLRNMDMVIAGIAQKKAEQEKASSGSESEPEPFSKNPMIGSDDVVISDPDLNPPQENSPAVARTVSGALLDSSSVGKKGSKDYSEDGEYGAVTGTLTPSRVQIELNEGFVANAVRSLSKMLETHHGRVESRDPSRLLNIKKIGLDTDYEYREEVEPQKEKQTVELWIDYSGSMLGDDDTSSPIVDALHFCAIVSDLARKGYLKGAVTFSATDGRYAKYRRLELPAKREDICSMYETAGSEGFAKNMSLFKKEILSSDHFWIYTDACICDTAFDRDLLKRNGKESIAIYVGEGFAQENVLKYFTRSVNRNTFSSVVENLGRLLKKVNRD